MGLKQIAERQSAATADKLSYEEQQEKARMQGEEAAKTAEQARANKEDIARDESKAEIQKNEECAALQKEITALQDSGMAAGATALGLALLSFGTTTVIGGAVAAS